MINPFEFDAKVAIEAILFIMVRRMNISLNSKMLFR